MINPLKRKSREKRIFSTKIAEPPPAEPPAKKEKAKEKPKASIRKYQDPEGLSVGKLEIGLWFIRHRRDFLYALYTLLIVVSAVTWSIFFYTFGYYIFKGMGDDNQLAQELTLPGVLMHQIVLRQSALPLEISALGSLPPGDSTDYYIKISNPNEKHWGEFTYQLAAEGSIIHQAENFILPGESKHLVMLAVESPGPSRSAKFILSRMKWSRLDPRRIEDWGKYRSERLDIAVSEKEFIPAHSGILTEKLPLNQLKFEIANNSAYNYYGLDCVILLYGRSNIVGVNKYPVKRFASGEKRSIEMTWPGRLSGVREIVVNPEVNIMDDAVFMRFDSGPGEPK